MLNVPRSVTIFFYLSVDVIFALQYRLDVLKNTATIITEYNMNVL